MEDEKRKSIEEQYSFLKPKPDLKQEKIAKKINMKNTKKYLTEIVSTSGVHAERNSNQYVNNYDSFSQENDTNRQSAPSLHSNQMKYLTMTHAQSYTK